MEKIVKSIQEISDLAKGLGKADFCKDELIQKLDDLEKLLLERLEEGRKN